MLIIFYAIKIEGGPRRLKKKSEVDINDEIPAEE